MARVNQRPWKIPGQRGKRKAWGFTVQLPCSPCPHRHPKTGAVLHPDGVRQVRNYRADWTRDDAEKELAKALLQIEPEKPPTEGMTFGEAVEQYLKTKARKKSLGFDQLYLGKLKAAFGAETPLSGITAARISAWKADRLSAVCPGTGKPYAAASINRPLAALRHLLQLAHDEWDVLPSVPRIRLEREPQGRIRWLEPDEEARLLTACAKSKNSELAKIVTVALETGLRRGELLGLAWDQVDLSRGVLRLEVTKSGRRREVPMRQIVYDVLTSLPGSREGRVFKTRSVRTAFEHAVKEAALDDFHFHDCRHHFASWFVMRGGGLQALKEILGHATLTMTQRYAHLSPGHLRSEIARTERVVQPAEVSAQASAQEVRELQVVSSK